MKTKSIFIISYTLIIFSGIADDAATDIQGINKITDAANDLTLLEFNNFVTSEGLRFPIIYSQWRINCATNWSANQKEIHLAARAAGLSTAKLLSRTASSLMLESESGKILSTYNALLEISRWISNPDGYGNFLLAKRANNILTVAAIRLTGDLTFSSDKLSFMVDQIDGVNFDENKLFNIYINEHPRTTRATSLETAQEEWRSYCGYGHPKRTDSGQCDDLLVSFGKDDYDQDIVKNFSCPELVWELKLHEILFLGVREQKQTYLKNLLLFRTNVGYYPIEILEQRSFHATPISASFIKAWDLFAYKKANDQLWRSVGSSAADVYHQLTSGYLMPDAEYQDWVFAGKPTSRLAFTNMIINYSVSPGN
jgi:hypothetical protein